MSAEKIARVVSLNPDGLQQTSYVQHQWTAYPETKDTLEDVLHRDYWQNHAKMMVPNSEIRCLWKDGTQYAILLVLDQGPNWAKVHLLSYHDLENDAAEAKAVRTEAEAEYFTKFGGPVDRWCVYRKSDNEKVSKGHADRATADAARTDLLKTLSR